MAPTSSKHLVEGELSVEILLYDVQPFGLSWFSLQLLEGGKDRPRRERPAFLLASRGVINPRPDGPPPPLVWTHCLGPDSQDYRSR